MVRPVRVRGRAEERALPVRMRQARDRALEAIALARRENLTIRTAARRAGVSVATVRRYAGEALTKDAFGRLVPTAADRLYRRVKVIGPEGPTWVDLRGSRVASTVGEYWNAVRAYLETGEEAGLARFRGLRVGGVELLTDPAAIEEVARRGEVSFEHLYEIAA
jgi:AcrR family transcriptional regulator